jgi:hypothetical protein
LTYITSQLVEPAETIYPDVPVPPRRSCRRGRDKRHSSSACPHLKQRRTALVPGWEASEGLTGHCRPPPATRPPLHQAPLRPDDLRAQRRQLPAGNRRLRFHNVLEGPRSIRGARRVPGGGECEEPWGGGWREEEEERGRREEDREQHAEAVLGPPRGRRHRRRSEMGAARMDLTGGKKENPQRRMGPNRTESWDRRDKPWRMDPARVGPACH